MPQRPRQVHGADARSGRRGLQEIHSRRSRLAGAAPGDPAAGTAEPMAEDSSCPDGEVIVEVHPRASGQIRAAITRSCYENQVRFDHFGIDCLDIPRSFGEPSGKRKRPAKRLRTRRPGARLRVRRSATAGSSARRCCRGRTGGWSPDGAAKRGTAGLSVTPKLEEVQKSRRPETSM